MNESFESQATGIPEEEQTVALTTKATATATTAGSSCNNDENHDSPPLDINQPSLPKEVSHSKKAHVATDVATPQVPSPSSEGHTSAMTMMAAAAAAAAASTTGSCNKDKNHDSPPIDINPSSSPVDIPHPKKASGVADVATTQGSPPSSTQQILPAPAPAPTVTLNNNTKTSLNPLKSNNQSEYHNDIHKNPEKHDCDNDNDNDEKKIVSSEEHGSSTSSSPLAEARAVTAAAVVDKTKTKGSRSRRHALPLNRTNYQDEVMDDAESDNTDDDAGIVGLCDAAEKVKSSSSPYTPKITSTTTGNDYQGPIVDVNDADILMGSRKCNAHPGNRVYRETVREFQSKLGDHSRSTVSQMVYEHIIEEMGARFLKFASDDQWHILPRVDALVKISKALVELRTPLSSFTPSSSKKGTTSTSSLLKSIEQGNLSSSTKRPKRKAVSALKIKEDADESWKKRKVAKKKKTENKRKEPKNQMTQLPHIPLEKPKKEQLREYEEFTYKEDPNQYYIEETAHLYHNPPFPSEWTNGVSIEDLRSIPPPPPLPSFPNTDSCDWSFDEKSRVLIADFSTCSITKENVRRQDIMTPEDSKFFFEMYERDDITVISRGLLNLSKVDTSLWSLDYVRRCVGREYYHKFRRFDRFIDEKGIEIYTEMDTLYSMRFEEYVQYCDQRKSYLEKRMERVDNCDVKEEANALKEDEKRKENEPYFTFEDHIGRAHTIGVWTSALYMIDVDMMRLIPLLNANFLESFELPSVLPGGSQCMMNSVTPEARPFMGPNLYVTPPASFTHFHQDGHGTVDSGHLCISGFNEVIMLRRLTERHKKHALWILSGKLPKGVHFDGLYSMPHGDGLGNKPKWPTVDMIEECNRMGYCPSLFTLEPGDLVHINKGRLHAFRKMSTAALPESDCFAERRKNVIQIKGLEGQEKLCISIAWDWMYRGISAAGINREVCTVLEGALLNKVNNVKSLAIPELALIQMAKTVPAKSLNNATQNISFLQDFKHKIDEKFGCESTKKEICRGIYPGLSIIVGQHIRALNIKECKSDERGKRLSIAKFPDTQENPSICPLDPYGDSDFVCKLCNDELSNVYYHCDGCERLLSKDFNICQGCYVEGRFMCKMQMHPSNPKRHATLNHIGDSRFDRSSRCPCKNGPACNFCGYCLGCSCRCHTWFTMRTRLCNMADEKLLLQTVKDTAEVSSKSALIAEDENQSNKDTFVETSIEYLRERLNYVYPGAGDDNLVGKKDATEIKNDRDGDQVSDKNTESESDGFIGADSTNDDSNDLVF